MDEEKNTTVLHIFPASNDARSIITESYSQKSVKVNSKHYFDLKVKKILKNKKPLITLLRKHPRVIREHTDFDYYPYKMTCPNCLSYIITKTYHYSNITTHTIAASLIPFCLCMIPYYGHEFKNTAHYCPVCKIYLGTKFGTEKYLYHLFN